MQNSQAKYDIFMQSPLTNQQSTISNQQSAINNQQSTISNQQTAHCSMKLDLINKSIISTTTKWSLKEQNINK